MNELSSIVIVANVAWNLCVEQHNRIEWMMRCHPNHLLVNATNIKCQGNKTPLHLNFKTLIFSMSLMLNVVSDSYR